MNTLKKDEAAKTVKSVVAKGCQVTGHDGKAVKAGGTVTLFDYEARRYTARGFLVASDGKLKTASAPPTRNEEGGE
jgi:hypothetical protein